MKFIIFLSVITISVVASFPRMEDPNQNWGLVVEPESYDYDQDYDHPRPLSFDPIVPGPRKLKTSSTQSSVDPRPSGPLDMSLHPGIWNKIYADQDRIVFPDDY